MNKKSSLPTILGWLAAILLFYWVAMSGNFYFSGVQDLATELVLGFLPFLGHNIPAISWNSDIWIPGLAALLMLIVCIHLAARKWARNTNRHWTAASTLCLSLLLPILFAISLIVPGILAQWEALRNCVWVVIDP